MFMRPSNTNNKWIAPEFSLGSGESLNETRRHKKFQIDNGIVINAKKQSIMNTCFIDLSYNGTNNSTNQNKLNSYIQYQRGFRPQALERFTRMTKDESAKDRDSHPVNIKGGDSSPKTNKFNSTM